MNAGWLATTALLLATAAGPAAPRLQFEATAIDLGDVVRGQDATGTFTYRNIGSAPLRIVSAKPG